MELKLKDLAKDHKVGLDALMAVLAYLYSGKVRPSSTMIALTRLVGPPFESEKPTNFGPQNLKKVQIKKKNNLKG